MATIAAEYRHPTRFPWLIMVAIAVGLLLGAELTWHAQQPRVGQTWNASSVKEAMQKGICKPILTYSCPRVQQIKIICQIHIGVDLWGGIIIGTAIPDHPCQITGFAARWNYWAKSLYQDGCTLTGAE